MRLQTKVSMHTKWKSSFVIVCCEKACSYLEHIGYSTVHT